MNGTIHVWGSATHNAPGPVNTADFDNIYNYNALPASVVIAYEGKTGQGGIQSITWQIATSRSQDNAVPYYLNYSGPSQPLLLYISLPSPFWYTQDQEYYDSSLAVTVAGQQNVSSALVGTVSDTASGKLLPGAYLSFGGVVQAADGNGAFSYQNIPANAYQLIVTNSGYAFYSRIITIPAFAILHDNVHLFPETNVITFCHEPPDNSLVGHVFLSLTASTGVKAYYGFYPAASKIAGPGYVNDDENMPWDIAISYPLTQTQYLAAARTITIDLASPPLYTLAGFNCMAWAAKVASAVGVILPPYKLGGIIPSDLAFGDSLINLGAGATYNGGLVVLNSGQFSSSSMDGPVFFDLSPSPYDFDYAGIEAVGHTNASNLATNLGLQLNHLNLGALNANTATGILFTLAGVDVTKALVSMNWGDGSAFLEQSLTLSHIYANGSYNANLLVIDDGAVHSYDFSVIVSAAAGSVSNIQVAPFPPVNSLNQGLSPASAVPNYPLPLAQSISFSTNGHAQTTFIGAAGETYEIQASTNLSQGFTTVTNLTAGTNGIFNFDDPNAFRNSCGFYRAALQ
ncbi:MAG TPA: hypothetical protein VGO59_20730 [Verrucomicrobiae bacterium]